MLKVTDFKQFLLAVLIVSFPNAKQHYIHADVANIRDKPSGNKTAQLNINTPVQIQQEQNEWCFIIGPENISGWVHKTLIGDHVLSEKELKDSINVSKGNKISWGQRLVKAFPREPGNWKILLQLHKDAGDTIGLRRVERVIELLDMTYLAECDCQQMKLKVAVNSNGSAVPLIHYIEGYSSGEKTANRKDSLNSLLSDVNSILDIFEWYDLDGNVISTSNRKIVNRSLWNECDIQAYDGFLDPPYDVLWISLGTCDSNRIYATKKMEIIYEGVPVEMKLDLAKIGKTLVREDAESFFFSEPTMIKKDILIRPFYNLGLLEVSMVIRSAGYDGNVDSWIYGILDKQGNKVYPQNVALGKLSNIPFFTFKESKFTYKISSYTGFYGGATSGSNYQDLLIIDKTGKITIQRILEVAWGS
jgi:hypothetical protein